MKDLVTALAKALHEIKPPVKDRKVDFTYNGQRTKYAYADLSSVIEAVKLPLATQGLIITHSLQSDEHKGFGLITTLMHTSGESIHTWYPMADPSTVKPQAFGSALTYARRYSISSLIGITSDEDDDGQAAEAPKAPMPKEVFDKARKSPDGSFSVTNLVKAKAELDAEPQAFKDARIARERAEIEASKIAYPPSGPVDDPPWPEAASEHGNAIKSPADFLNPADYKLGFGKHTGKSLKELGPAQVQSYMDWAMTKQPLSKKMRDFVDYGRLYLDSQP
jgi:hypothetical protein